ncbi:MAG: multicopper oxidase domain-containing protein [Flavobacteriales bacterium]|nr:multicopper oxidase domain-containing protein [Flavobacteriales bacterium]
MLYKGILMMVCMLCIQTIVFGGNTASTIYINSGVHTNFDGSLIQLKAFNPSPTFTNRNVQLTTGIGDTIFLQVINTDVIEHGFDVKWLSGLRDTIPAGDTINVEITSASLGLFIYYDHMNAPDQAYLGLSGIIAVGVNSNSFYWNIKDHELGLNDSIMSGGMVDWSTYYPDYFTINGNSHPSINLDTTARVTGSIGDTILIFIANTGQAEHSLHFHGYHSEILYSSARPVEVGRSKDTFPVKVMEAVILRMIPDQVGEYPVHDHNLLSVTGGGLYPFGMFSTILIQ